MQKTWYFKYKSQHICVKLSKGKYWFFFGKEKLKEIWYQYKPYFQYEIFECFEKIFGRVLC